MTHEPAESGAGEGMNPDVSFDNVSTGLANMLFILGALVLALVVWGIRDISKSRKDDDRD